MRPLRYDTFETVDVDLSGAGGNDEEGDAWTFAFFFEPRHFLRLGLELSRLDATRSAATEVGFDPETGAPPCQARAAVLLRLVAGLRGAPGWEMEDTLGALIQQVELAES